MRRMCQQKQLAGSFCSELVLGDKFRLSQIDGIGACIITGLIVSIFLNDSNALKLCLYYHAVKVACCQIAFGNWHTFNHASILTWGSVNICLPKGR